MSILGPDNRSLVTDFSASPFDAIVAVDALYSNLSLLGSGVLVSPSHVLTAAHVVAENANNIAPVFRVTHSSEVPNLPPSEFSNGRASRSDVPVDASEFNASRADVTLLDTNWFEGGGPNDLALISLDAPLISPADAVGPIAFEDISDRLGLSISTAGYPLVVEFENFNKSINEPFVLRDEDGNAVVTGTFYGGEAYTSASTLMSARGFIDLANSNAFSFSETIDIEGGQSGSGIFSELQSTGITGVVGVVSYQNGFDNFGAGITLDYFSRISNVIFSDISPIAARSFSQQLSVASIVGSDRGTEIVGTQRREIISGNGGDDRLVGAAGDDTLDGGDGIDFAPYLERFDQYSLSVFDPDSNTFQIVHDDGQGLEGSDTLTDVEFAIFREPEQPPFLGGQPSGVNDFFVPLRTDRNDRTKIADGPSIFGEELIISTDGAEIGRFSLDIPAWSFDGDVEYQLTVGTLEGIQYNFAYVIDVSGSMEGEPLAQAQAAYQALTEDLTEQFPDIDSSADFAVVAFSTDATLLEPVSAAETVAAVNGLTAGGTTDYEKALSTAAGFFDEPEAGVV